MSEAILDFALMLARGHINEVHHHQTTKVAQTQLTGHFVGGLKIGVERGLLDIAALGGARRVDIDGGQGFGLIDHDRAAGRQTNLTFKGALDLGFDLEAREQRGGVVVVLKFALVVRHHLLDEVTRFVEQFFVVDQDFSDVAAQIVAQRADDQARFLIDQERRGLLQSRLGDGTPDLQQVVEIPLQFVCSATDTGGANDDAHFFRDIELVERFFQGGPVVALNPARHAAGARAVRHQHQVAAGQRDIGSECSALVAALFLVDLHHHFLAFAQQFLDGALVAIGTVDEVVAGDFFQWQEAVAIAAVFDKSGFQRGLQAGDPTLIDVALFLLFGRLFDVQVVKVLTINNCNPQLFFLGCVNQHPLHCYSFLTRSNREERRASAPC